MPSDVRGEKEKNEIEKTSTSLPMLFVHVGKSSSETLRSSRSQMFFKIGVLKNFSMFAKNTCVRVSF